MSYDEKIISLLLTAVMLGSMIPPAFAAEEGAIHAANELHELGLFNGVGNNADGTPNFDLDRTPTRHEAITMLVNLLGKKDEATAGNWETPFTDVADWAKPFVGYAYANGLTAGTSATTYGGDQLTNAAQYLSFVLTALGYKNGVDFKWDKASELSDQLGFTNGQYSNDSVFTRGDVAQISYAALDAKIKGSDLTLKETIGSVSVDPEQPHSVIPEGCRLYMGFNGDYYSEISALIAEPEDGDKLTLAYDEFAEEEKFRLAVVDDVKITWTSADTDIIDIKDGVIVCKESGKTKITATLPDGTSISIPCVFSDEGAYFDEYYEMFYDDFVLKDSSTHVYMVNYDGRLSRADFVEEFQFGSEMWKQAAQKFAEEEVVSEDKYASVIGFYLPKRGGGSVFLGNVTHRNGDYNDYWKSAALIADEDY